MNPDRQSSSPWLLVLVPVVFALFTGATEVASLAPTLAPETVACRVLEVHTATQPGVTLLVFHQREANDRARLGTLLRERDGAAVQFQTPDGQWHAATVLRLKSCFGRGLLLFPAGTAPLAEKDEFTLRFPPDGGK